MRLLLSICLTSAIHLIAQAQLTVPWAPLGGGTNQKVETLLRLSNGDLLVAGQFTIAGGTAQDRVARWNGATYLPMPGFPLQFDIYCAEELNDTIYVGGRSTAPFSHYDLMRWDGSTWTAGSVIGGLLPGVMDLFQHDGVLYASGLFTGIAGAGAQVSRKSGSTWSPVGQTLNRGINCISHFNGHLVCGGAFTGNFLSTDSALMHVAYLDGDTWRQLGDGLDGSVNTFLVDGDTLFAGGDCVGQGLTHFGLASMQSGSTSWERLMPNIGDYMAYVGGAQVAILDMVRHDGRIYLGGSFVCIVPGAQGRGVAVYNGTPDDVQPHCAFGGTVYALEVMAPDLLVAGGLGAPYQNIAVTDITLGTGPRAEEAEALRIVPNPVHDRIMVDLPIMAPAHVLDLMGRPVMELHAEQGARSVDVHGLPAGAYLLRVADERGVRIARFVKQ